MAMFMPYLLGLQSCYAHIWTTEFEIAESPWKTLAFRKCLKLGNIWFWIWTLWHV